MPRAVRQRVIAGVVVDGVERLPVLHGDHGAAGAVDLAGQEPPRGVSLQVCKDPAQHPQGPQEPRQAAGLVQSHAEQEHRERLAAASHPAAGADPSRLLLSPVSLPQSRLLDPIRFQDPAGNILSIIQE
jgi:hypothetical protein